MIDAICQADGEQRVYGSEKTRAPVDVDRVRDHYYDREKLFGSLLTRSDLCMVVLDSELRVLEASPELLRLFDRTPRELVGRYLTALLHPSTRQQVLPKLSKLIDQRHGHFATRALLGQSSGATFPGRLIAVVSESYERSVRVIVVVCTEKQSTDPCNAVKGLDAQILEGVAAGKPTAQLATELYLSRQGVEYHVSTMMRKFAVPNRAALVSKAFSMGMFSMDKWPPKILVKGIE